MSELVTAAGTPEPLIIGRYALFDALASGGMATVHLGRLLGSVGFGRTVAIKRLHAHYTSDPEFVTMFMDEARIVARIRHPNVVPMIDVLESSKGLFLIMEYVHGEAFSKLLRTCRSMQERTPILIIGAIMHGVLLGLHAAHETRGPNGELLDVVHRDVSPQNIIVGSDGVARVLDFGVAKAAGRAQVTREGQIKGKLAYMAPEQIRGRVDRRADVYAAAVVLWEALAGRRLHEGAKDVEIVTRVIQGSFPPPSQFRSDVPPELDAIVMRGLEVDPAKRYPNAREMALDLERRVGVASPSVVGDWLDRLAHEALQSRANKVAAIEKLSGSLVPMESAPPPPGGEYGSDPRLSSGQTGGADFTGLLQSRGANAPASSDPSLSSSSFTADASITGTPLGTELPMPRLEGPSRDLTTFIAIISFCGALALIGVLLAGYSLYARRSVSTSSSSSASAPSSAPSLRPSSAPTVRITPNSIVPGVPDPASPRSSEEPSVTEALDSGPPVASSSAANSKGPRKVVTPPRAPASALVPPSKNNNCDPPYTTDSAGHRHYLPECD